MSVFFKFCVPHFTGRDYSRYILAAASWVPGRNSSWPFVITIYGILGRDYLRYVLAVAVPVPDCRSAFCSALYLRYVLAVAAPVPDCHYIR